MPINITAKIYFTQNLKNYHLTLFQVLTDNLKYRSLQSKYFLKKIQRKIYFLVE